MALAAMTLTACERAEPPSRVDVRPVRTITVDARPAGETATLSGTVEAKTEVDLAFRNGGRIVERLVDVGDRVVAGQVIARLDPRDEENELRASRAALSAAEGQLVEAELNYDRQRQLLERGHTTRQRHDEVVQLVRTLRARVDEAAARVALAEDRLADTVLEADAPGEITVRSAESGQVVQAGQPIVRIARKDGRDAVFDVPPSLMSRGARDATIAVALSMDPAVTAEGRVREISPQADSATGTFRVRVGLADPPRALRLGSTVTGRIALEGGEGVVVPASALSRSKSAAAV
jgi:RND family efflux transporter MFP subunit